MATFCYYCEIVGHSEKNCIVRKGDARNKIISEGQYGDWLKADLCRGRGKAIGGPGYKRREERARSQINREGGTKE